MRNRCLLPLLVLALPAFGQHRWIRLTTPHFELYTSDTPDRAHQALQTFEQVHRFFLQKSNGKDELSGRVQIVAFSSEKEFRPYRLNEANLAFYERTRGRDYIVMQDLNPAHHQAAIHEYTHLMVEHLGLSLPLWLNEGLAEVYSTLESRGEQALVGLPLPVHYAVLSRNRWLDWNTFLAVDRNSPYYNENDKASVFYAQSWALTHMLMLGANYYAKFPQFIDSVSSGLPVPQALAIVYGSSLPAVAKDVQSYLRQNTLKVSVEDIRLTKLETEPEIADVPDFKVNLVLANLMASRPGGDEAEARQILLGLKARQPENPEIDESLAYLAWQSHDVRSAQIHFAEAVRHGLQNPDSLYLYAELEQSANGDPQEIMNILRHVLNLAPDNAPAKFFLISMAASQNDCGLALSTASDIRVVSNAQAFPFFSAVAYCRAKSGDLQGAETYAQKALQYAKTPSERTQTEKLLTFVAEARRTKDSLPGRGSTQRPQVGAPIPGLTVRD